MFKQKNNFLEVLMDKYELLNKKFKNCEPVFGTQMTVTCSTVMLEKLYREDLDFMLFDMEHGIYNTENLIPLLQVTRLMGLPNIVRIPSIEYPYIARAIDMGADAIMVPRVETIDQVKLAVNSIRFYPIGNTGFGGHGLLRKNETMDDFQKNRHLILQIESPKGFENLPAILDTYGDHISSIIIGPYDFSIMIGEPGNTLCENCQKWFKKIFDVCKAYKKSCGIYCNDVNAANVYKKLGAEVFWFSTDLNFLLKGYNETFDDIKELF